MSDGEREVSAESSDKSKAEKQAKKEYEKKQRELLQKKIKEVAVETKNKVVNFLKKYLLGKKTEDRKKVVESSKDDKKEITEKETSNEGIEKKFSEIQEAQTKGQQLTEEQQALLSRLATEAAVDPEALKKLKAEVPESETITPEAEKPKPNLAVIDDRVVTPEMLLQLDFSDYQIAENANGEQVLRLKSASVDSSSKPAEPKKAEKSPSADKFAGLKGVIPEKDVPFELLADPEFLKLYETAEEAGNVFYIKKRPRVGGAADEEEGPEADEGADVPDPEGGPEEETRLETGGDTEEEYLNRRAREREEAERRMTPEELRAQRRRDVLNEEAMRQFEEQIRQQQAAEQNLPPEMRGRRRMQGEDIPNPPEKAFIPPEVPEGGDSNDPEYQERLRAAQERYYDAERRATELEANRKQAVYLSMELQAAKSETEVHWIIEEALRAGENDWTSPDAFQQATNQVIQAIDLVFSGDQRRREQFARLARARMAGYACEFTARFVNGGALADQITNYFQDYFEEMRDLPGVRRMMELMEEADTTNELDPDGRPVNIRGAYFRKLNFAKNKAKREEWDPYFDLKDIYNPDGSTKKDAAWGQWVVDKKFKLFREAKAKKAGDEKLDNIKLDYVEDFSRDQDEEVVRILLAKTQGKNDPVKAIKELHRVIFPEFYQEKGLNVQEPSGYEYLSPEIREKLHNNDRFKAAVRELTDREREARRTLLEDQVTLSAEWGTPLDRMIYQLNRAVNLGQRMHHSLQFSTHWDNLRWKNWDDMTPEQRELFRQAQKDIYDADHGTDRHGPHDLDKYGRNVAGGLILLNPVVDWAMNDDPRYKGSLDKKRKDLRDAIKNETDEEKRKKLWDQLHKLTNETKRVNLRIAGEKRARRTLLKHQIKFETDDEKKKAMDAEIKDLEKDLEIEAIDDMRNAKNHLFTIQVDKSYRDFYEKYWELIDHENSFSGDSSREARKAQFFGRTLEQSGEAEPGKRFMRRFADTGAKDIGMFFAFESSFDMIDNFTSVFNRVKRWSHVMKNGDKLRGTLMQMLNDPELLADPVKFTTEIKKNYRPHMATDDTWDKEYYSDEEYFQAAHDLESQLDYVTGQWAEAIIEYNKTHSWQQHAAGLRQEVLTKAIAQMVGHELITAHRGAHILDNQFGKLPKRILYEITHVLLRPKEGIWALIMELLEESGKSFNQGFKAA